MLRIDHTAYPDCRKHEEGNTVKPGGLWYGDEQNEFLKEARRCAQPKKRKDGVKEFSKWFWIVVIIIAIVLIGIYK